MCKVISSHNLLAFEQFNIDLKKHCVALRLLSRCMESQSDVEEYFGLFLDRVSFLEQTCDDFKILENCIFSEFDLDFGECSECDRDTHA